VTRSCRRLQEVGSGCAGGHLRISAGAIHLEAIAYACAQEVAGGCSLPVAHARAHTHTHVHMSAAPKNLLQPPACSPADHLLCCVAIGYNRRRSTSASAIPPANLRQTSRNDSPPPEAAARASASRAALQRAGDRTPGSGRRHPLADRASWAHRLRGSGCRTAELQPPISATIDALGA
jgi:hypothetical protein